MCGMLQDVVTGDPLALLLWPGFGFGRLQDGGMELKARWQHHRPERATCRVGLRTTTDDVHIRTCNSMLAHSCCSPFHTREQPTAGSYSW